MDLYHLLVWPVFTRAPGESSSHEFHMTAQPPKKNCQKSTSRTFPCISIWSSVGNGGSPGWCHWWCYCPLRAPGSSITRLPRRDDTFFSDKSMKRMPSSMPCGHLLFMLRLLCNGLPTSRRMRFVTGDPIKSCCFCGVAEGVEYWSWRCDTVTIQSRR